MGFKAAGRRPHGRDAALYIRSSRRFSARPWLSTDLFRISASSAANNLLSPIEGRRSSITDRPQRAIEVCSSPDSDCCFTLGRRPAEKPVCPEHSAGKPRAVAGQPVLPENRIAGKGRGLTISAALNRGTKLRKAATGRRRERTGRRWKDNGEDNREDNRKVTEGQPGSGRKATEVTGKASGTAAGRRPEGAGMITRKRGNAPGRRRKNNRKAAGKRRRFFGNEKSRRSRSQELMQTEDSTRLRLKPGLSDSVY